LAETGGYEHLWFEVHGVEGGEVDATCLNSPHHVPSLAEGARARQQLSLLSDWVIVTPHADFNPSSILELVRSRGPTLQ
jgi:hypothetical protein